MSPLKKRHVVVAGIHNINRLQLPSCCALKASLLHPTFNQVESTPVIVFCKIQCPENICCQNCRKVCGKFTFLQALLWHMVYEEEIGSVKGHIGPLILS